MKRINFLIIAFGISVTSIFAKSIDVNYAMQVAQNFYQQTTGKTAELSLVYQQLNTDATNGVSIGEPIYYVFNVNRNDGFIMVSGDDLVRPILGYNTQGQFVIQNAPPAITDWFGKYAYQIAYAKAHQIPATQTTTEWWSNLYNNIPQTTKDLTTTPVWPLLTTTWDQGQYYNAMCPATANSMQGYGGNCATGCGATAMAQILNYWNYPTQGMGSNTDTSTITTASYGAQYADFATTTYNWTNMPNSVSSANSDVATLMYDCGVALNMVYTPTDCVSRPQNSYNAYTAYFGYDPVLINLLAQSSHSPSDWIDSIQNDLDNGRPIQYFGFSADGKSGHTFVLDGCDGNNNFHINWGWSGVDDGFYALTNLAPPSQGAGGGEGNYSSNEIMITEIQPANLSPNTVDIELNSDISISPNPITFNQTFTVTADLINDGSGDFNGSYYAALFDATGTFIRYIGPIQNTGGTPLAAGDDATVTFTDATVFINPPGYDTIGIYFQPTGETTWTLVGAINYPNPGNPISVPISGPTDPDIQLYSDITASGSAENILVQGGQAAIAANLTNTGGSTYTGEYAAILLDLEGNNVEQLATYNETNGLAAGASYPSPGITFNCNSVTASEGQYLLAIAESTDGGNTWNYCDATNYTNPIYVDVVNQGIFASVNQVSSNTLHIYPNPTNSLINIDAGDIRGNYTIKLFNIIGQQASESNGILNGQNISMDVSSFAGGSYIIQLKTASDNIISQFIVK